MEIFSYLWFAQFEAIFTAHSLGAMTFQAIKSVSFTSEKIVTNDSCMRSHNHPPGNHGLNYSGGGLHFRSVLVTSVNFDV